MGRKEDNIEKAKDLMNKLNRIRNIGIAAHIDHGKTTFSDNLLAGCGMMSEDLAGKQLVLDLHNPEQVVYLQDLHSSFHILPANYLKTWFSHDQCELQYQYYEFY